MHNDYTLQLDGTFYRIERGSICAGLRGATVRIERRLDGSLAVRFRQRYLAVTACAARPQPRAASQPPRSHPRQPSKPSPATRAWMSGFLQQPGPPLWKASQIDRTRTSDKWD